MVVYWVRNNINNKLYIGQTTNLEKRWYMHNWDGSNNSLLHKALNKYGKENFHIEAIHLCESKEEMDFVEIFYISFLNTKSPNGYNLTAGGEGSLGIPCSEEKKKKIGAANKGKPPNSRLLNQSGSKNYMYGRTITEKQLEAIRKANTGHTRSFGNKNALGHVVSEESKEKMRKPHKKKTTCKRGHEKTPENTGQCKTCVKARNDAR